MSRLPLLLCIVLVLSGCPMDTGEDEFRLEVSVIGQSDSGHFVGTIRADLSGDPPNSIVYHNVKVILLNYSTELDEYTMGNITTDRWTVKKNISVPKQPERALIKYDSVSGSDRAGIVRGVRWDAESDVYVPYSNYTKQY